MVAGKLPNGQPFNVVLPRLELDEIQGLSLAGGGVFMIEEEGAIPVARLKEVRPIRVKPLATDSDAWESVSQGRLALDLL